MISRLHGPCVIERPGTITLMAGGIGWSVQVPERLVPMPDQTIELFISWRWNTEQGPSLYGFIDHTDRTAFELLLTCTGVGPKLALSALNTYDGATLLSLLANGQISALSTITGFGKKRAESVVLAVQEKAATLATSHPTSSESGNTIPLYELSQALTSLGYSRLEIQQTTQWLSHQPEVQNLPFEQLLRKSLTYVSGAKASI